MFIVEISKVKKPRRGDMSGFHAALNGAGIFYWSKNYKQPRCG